MVDIEREHDPEILRQVARLQGREIERLHAKVRAMASQLAKVTGDPTMVQRELIRLQEILAQREHLLFGPSSERRGPSPKKERTKVVGHGPTPQPVLPVVEVLHELDDADKQCPACGGGLTAWEGQFEESEEIDVVHASYTVKKHKRQKYRCKCGGCVDTALGLPKLRPGNRYSIDFAIEVAIGKYLDHLPLERQVRMMRRDGLDVTSQVLWDQIEILARLLGEVPERLLHEHILKQACVGMDETHWLMLRGEKDSAKAEENRRWYAWSVCSTDAVMHRIFDTRSHQAAKELLGDYTGVVLTDGYAVYEKVAKETGRFVHALCWSHVRREFLGAEKFFPRDAGAIVGLIDELFRIEREVPTTGPPEERLRLRGRLRDEKSRWVVEALRLWAEDLRKSALPGSALGKAGAYMRGLWPGLVRFVDDPRIPIDNNATERALRGIVVGRKNHYGSKSRRGTEVAGVFYTILETCKLAGVDPRDYLRRAVEAKLSEQAVPLPHQVVATAVEAA